MCDSTINPQFLHLFLCLGLSIVVFAPLLIVLLLLIVGFLIVLHRVGHYFRHHPTSNLTSYGQKLAISQDCSSFIGVKLTRPQLLGFVVPQLIVTPDTFTRSELAAEIEEQQITRKNSFSDW
jgi:hypothetical protein